MIVPSGISDAAIEKHYATGRLRVVQERNDIFLTHVVGFISPNTSSKIWSNIRPEYQRRLRWDNKKKSQLIESFIMNVPVPPVFLYEKSLGNFEVMDGQQRLNAIATFYDGEFSLQGLKIWQALNGKRYSQLPPLIRRGLDRAKISAITLMSDNTAEKEDSVDLRAQVFDRLNTGGERLNPHELRNALYGGTFNDLLIDLSRQDKFCTAWDIPKFTENVFADGSISEELERNIFYKRMSDVEIVLRFFAFREPAKVSGSVRGMLDESLRSNRNPEPDRIDDLRRDFINALDLCVDVFGSDVFRLPGPKRSGGTLSRPLYDAQMISMYNHRKRAADVRVRAKSIKRRILELASPGSDSYDLVVGRANTAATIKERIKLVSDSVSAILNE